MRDLMACGTAQLGGHLEYCPTCGFSRPHYNSCRNRHCPSCQEGRRRAWSQAEQRRLLPVPYFQAVFTLPDCLNPLALLNPRRFYHLFFRAVSEVLLEFGQRHLRGQLGITAVLHTWGQTLILHIHLHCLVTAGAYDAATNQWHPCSNGYLFPVDAVREVYQGRLLDYLEQALLNGQLRCPDPSLTPSLYWRQLRSQLLKHPWTLFFEAPPASSSTGHLVGYLSNYTQHTAISNRRIQEVSTLSVTFRYKDYKDRQIIKWMKLDSDEFIRRFLLHILPRGLVRVRHYGLLANGQSQRREACRAQLPAPAPTAAPSQPLAQPQISSADPESNFCPQCHQSRLLWRPLPGANSHAPPNGSSPALAA